MDKEVEKLLEKEGNLTEDQVKDVLKSFDIPTTTYSVIDEKDELKDLELDFPVALKVCSEDILHKTDVGGVKLNIADLEGLKKSFDEFKKKFPSERFLVEEMGEEGIEIIVGLTRDPTFGLTLMFGIGGIFTEVYEDVAFRVVPITSKEAEQMLTELKGRKLLEGFRGMEADREAIVDLLLNVSELGEKLEDVIDQMDLNPVFVYEKGLCVVDAKLILKDKEKSS